MNQADRQRLNRIYAPLEERRMRMHGALAAAFPVTAGWFNGHYRRDEAGEYGMDCFPIPEISVTGVCDVELHFDMTNVTAKLRREDVLACDFAPFADLDFVAYGVEDYLLDFRTEGISVEEMCRNVRRSDEKEVFFSFGFDAGVTGDKLVEFVQLLINCGFYY